MSEFKHPKIRDALFANHVGAPVYGGLHICNEDEGIGFEVEL